MSVRRVALVDDAGNVVGVVELAAEAWSAVLAGGNGTAWPGGLRAAIALDALGVLRQLGELEHR